MKHVNYWVAPAVEIKSKSANEVLNNVCQHFEISLRQLKSKYRQRKLVDARSIVGYVLTKNSDLTLTEIGNLLNRTHCNIVHYNKKVSGFIEVDRDYKELVNKFV